MKMRLLFALVLVLACLGCQCSASDPVVGTVRPLQNQVWKGFESKGLSLMDEVEDLFNGETLKVESGGEAQLNFPNHMIIHLYNDSSANLIYAEPDPNTPMDIRMRLIEGGLVGIVKESGQGQAVFETPGGGTIYVTGTEFFLYYESKNQYLLAGNFQGSISLEPAGGGERYDIPNRTYILYQPGKEIIPVEIPDAYDTADFMRSAANGGMGGRLSNSLIDMALMTPANITLTLESISPDSLFIGDCPSAPDTTYVTATMFSAGPVERVWVKWALNEQSGTVDMSQIQTGTFQAPVGPVTEQGDLFLYIYAKDDLGRFVQIGPFIIKVGICIS